MQGTIINADVRGFCFILPEDGGADVFAGRKQFTSSDEFRVPNIVGCWVEYSYRDGPKGAEADGVVIVDGDNGKHREHGVIEDAKAETLRIRADTGEVFMAHKSNCFGIDFPVSLGTRVVFTIVIKKRQIRAVAVKAEQS